MIELVNNRLSAIEDLCRRYAVQKLELFGSAADGSFDPSRSDLDFLVEFGPDAATRSFHGYFDLRSDLERLFGRKVDLVMPGAVKNPLLKAKIDRHRAVLYAA